MRFAISQKLTVCKSFSAVEAAEVQPDNTVLPQAYIISVFAHDRNNELEENIWDLYDLINQSDESLSAFQHTQVLLKKKRLDIPTTVIKTMKHIAQTLAAVP